MNNQVLKKEKILELLNSSKIILKQEYIDYLESIINLDFSVVKDVISENERKALSELQVYRSALIYNIYKRDVTFFNNEYQKNNFKFFNFYINSNDVPTIKLFVKIASSDFELDSNLKKQIELIKEYFSKLQKDYDLKESSFTSGKKFVKKMPGLQIKKEFEIM